MHSVDWWTWKCARCSFEAKHAYTVNNQQVVAEAIVRTHIQSHEEPPSVPARIKALEEGKATGSATEELATLRSLLQTTEAARDEAREIVAKVNNEVVGSYGYFTEPSCVDAIQALKWHANQVVSRLTSLTQAQQRLIAQWRESADRMDDGTGMTSCSLSASDLRGCADDLARLGPASPTKG